MWARLRMPQPGMTRGNKPWWKKSTGEKMTESASGSLTNYWDAHNAFLQEQHGDRQQDGLKRPGFPFISAQRRLKNRDFNFNLGFKFNLIIGHMLFEEVQFLWENLEEIKEADGKTKCLRKKTKRLAMSPTCRYSSSGQAVLTYSARRCRFLAH